MRDVNSRDNGIERRRAAFLAHSGGWIRRYVDNAEKEGEKSSSVGVVFHDEIMEVDPIAPINQNSRRPKKNSRRPKKNSRMPKSFNGGQKGEDPEWSSRRALILEKLKTYRKIQLKHKVTTMGAAGIMRKMQLTLADTEGEVEGVEVGDTFESRAEMSVIGLHKYLVKGISVLKRPHSQGGSIGSSISFGHGSLYLDNRHCTRDNEPIIYTGEGGFPSTRGPLSNREGGYRDQVLEGGNLALVNSFEQKIPVRVMRGVDDTKYMYVGLYEVVEYKYEEGEHGNKVFKFYLKPFERE